MQLILPLSMCFFKHLDCFALIAMCCQSPPISPISLYSTRQLRSKDISKFHIQLCLSLGAMLIVFFAGVGRTENRGVCITCSVLIHYCTLVAWMWMGAEAVVMFKKLVIVFGEVSLRFILFISLVCWGNHTNSLTNTHTYTHIHTHTVIWEICIESICV